MKKKTIRIILVVLLAVLVGVVGYCLYMEFHFHITDHVTTKQTPAQILKEMPDIAFTQKDEAMFQALLAAPEVEEGFLLAEKDENGIYVFPSDEANELLANWIPEGYETLELSIIENTVYVHFLARNKQSIIYAFDPDFTYKTKVIGVYKANLFDTPTVKIAYQNINGEITKIKAKHRWFSWIEMTRD